MEHDTNETSVRLMLPGATAVERNGLKYKTETVSAIIPTKNRCHDLESTVRTLLSQTCQASQLIIIDQSSDSSSQDRIDTLMRALGPQCAPRLVYVRDTSISGGAVARNRGMELADGSIWLFLDDDVELEPDFIEQILASYQEHPDALGVSGVVTNYVRPTLFFRIWNRLFCTGPFWDERQPVYWNANRRREQEPVRVRRFGAGLMSFRAVAIVDHRFDDHLRGTSDGEDVDFCARLGSHAILLITPRARLLHKHSPHGRSREHWLARHARTMWYLYLRNWDHGFTNRLALLWLNCGYVLTAGAVAMKRMSIQPFRDYRQAVRDGHVLIR